MIASRSISTISGTQAADDYIYGDTNNPVSHIIRGGNNLTKFSVKRIITLFVVCLVLILVLILAYRYNNVRSAEFRTRGNDFQILQNGQWSDFLIKGVNMGAGKPGSFPGEMQINKEEYSRWFKQIADMNINVVRVYTILSPDFYEALFEYNMFTSEPIYVIHGVWLNEEAMVKNNDAYFPEIKDDFEKEIKTLIDVLHGKCEIEPRNGHASGTYRWDVSPYIIGYILGIELDAEFVINTNELNAGITNFDGNYLYTENASPHECWLAQMGDLAISYEQEKYSVQKCVSWSNWLTTDPLEHTNEPMPEAEDAVSVDTEHILIKETYTAGLFASYHIYPYYPEFMMYQPEYASYIDQSGKLNPYEAYLLDLVAHHNVPVLVAEFGVPTSRGNTHENVITSYNQGFITEEKQGEYIADMFDSIIAADCAGGIIFTWQDEWFKRSWNTSDLDDPERRAYWSNYQVSEQFYGILTFEPGEKKSVSYVDGDISEWSDDKLVCQSGDLSLYMTSDAKFVYLMLKNDGGNIDFEQYIIGIDSVEEQGNFNFNDMGISFSGAMDMVVVMDGQDNSRILTDAYYDVWYRLHSLIYVLERNTQYEQKNSGIFNPINLILRNEITLPLTGELLPQSSYETGRLLHGNANPDSADFNSLADFMINSQSNAIEIRIPWQLLNVADPSAKKVIGDLYEYDYFDTNLTNIEGFSLEVIALENGEEKERADGYYFWNPWEEPEYHERLKKSYYILQEYFSKY